MSYRCKASARAAISPLSENCETYDVVPGGCSSGEAFVLRDGVRRLERSVRLNETLCMRQRIHFYAQRLKRLTALLLTERRSCSNSATRLSSGLLGIASSMTDSPRRTGNQIIWMSEQPGHRRSTLPLDVGWQDARTACKILIAYLVECIVRHALVPRRWRLTHQPNRLQRRSERLIWTNGYLRRITYA